jgi:quercetin dioxygenase-like cupin family protein
VHKHGTAEFIVVFSGEAWFTSEAGEELLGPGDCVKVFVGTPHSVKAGPGGAWFSVTTVPREEGLTYGR